MIYDSSKLTFGRILRACRRTNLIDGSEPSQREFCQILKQQYSLNIDHYLLSKLENNHINIKLPEYDALVKSIAEIFSLDISWLETIRQQTEVRELDLSGGIFPIYYKDSKEN